MDLSPRTRVYIRGGHWVSNWSGFWPMWSDTSLHILIKRPLDLSRLMCWLSYVGYQHDTAACQPSAWICHLSESFEKICKVLVVPVCHHHTPAIKDLANHATEQYFGCHGLWHSLPQMKLSDMKQVEKNPYPSRQKNDQLDGMHVRGVWQSKDFVLVKLWADYFSF